MDDKYNNNSNPDEDVDYSITLHDFSHISQGQHERRRAEDERNELMLELMRDFSAELKETNKRLSKIENYFLVGRVVVAVSTAIFAGILWAFDWFTQGSMTLKSMIKDWLDIKGS